MNSARIQISLMLMLIFFQYENNADASSEIIHRILIKGIEANFSGDYDRASEIFSTIQKVDPDHPSQAFYQAVVLFWRNNLDTGNPRYTSQIRQYLNQAREQAGQMLAADEKNLDALHYMGLVYTYLGRLEALSGSLYKGGVLGERGRKYLEKAIEICGQQGAPQSSYAGINPCEDIYFPYGAYSYFAGRLPKFIKAFNFLWFIPSGSTEEGLKALERAGDKSDLHRLGAESLLVGIFLNFETTRLKTAMELSTELVSRFPDNPYLEVQHARLMLSAGVYPDAVIKSDKIIEKVDKGLRNYDMIVRQAALLVKAEAAIQQENKILAGEILTQLENTPAYQNNSLRPNIDLLLGMLADREMKREKAVGYYERVMTYSGPLRNRMMEQRAEQYLKSSFSRSMEGSTQ